MQLGQTFKTVVDNIRNFVSPVFPAKIDIPVVVPIDNPMHANDRLLIDKNDQGLYNISFSNVIMHQHHFPGAVTVSSFDHNKRSLYDNLTLNQVFSVVEEHFFNRHNDFIKAYMDWKQRALKENATVQPQPVI